MNKKITFAKADEYLAQSADLGHLRQLVNDITAINQILSQIPQYAALCHCGAIDYENDALVLYCGNNADFHSVNYMVPLIRDHLQSNGINFHKLWVKIRPRHHRQLAKTQPKPLTEQQKTMLEKFAEAINRPDLLVKQEDSDEVAVSDYAIKF